MALVPRTRSGAIYNPFARSTRMRTAEGFIRNPYVQRAARMGMQYAAGKIQNWWKNRGSDRMSVGSSSTRFGTGAPVHAGVVPSGSSSMRVSRPNRRRFKLPSGRFRGHNRGLEVLLIRVL